MSESKNVFITPKGTRYHFYTTCNYLKGRKYEKISYTQAKNVTKGACTSCQRLFEKNGDDLNQYENQEEEDEKEEEEINDLNNNKNNKKNKNKFMIIENKKIINKKKLEEKKEIKNNSSSSSSSHSNSPKKEKENNNFFNSNLNLNFDDISGIKDVKQNSIDNDNSKNDIQIFKEKKEKNKYNDNKNKQISKNNIVNNISDNEEEEDEKEENNDNINNINNNINKEKEDDFNNNNINTKNSLENMSKLKYNLNPNLPKKDLNWTGRDFFLLEETHKSSKLLFLQKIDPIPNPRSKNIFFLLEKNENLDNNISNISNKGNFKFKFEITPYKELKEALKISVGFEIDFFEEENIIKKENQKMNISYETLIIIRHFLIYKKTNNINVMINISNGKFFVIGKDELDKRANRIFLNSENTEVLFLKNFKGIKLEQTKDVRPIFEYDINYLKLANIVVGGNNLNNFVKNK